MFPAVVRRLFLEGYAANRVAHPGAVAVLDDGITERGEYFLVIELLDGRSFDQYVRLERVTPEEVARITIAVLDVLAAAHARGIVHRDIKPGNVLILRDGERV